MNSQGKILLFKEKLEIIYDSVRKGENHFFQKKKVLILDVYKGKNCVNVLIGYVKR